MYKNIDFDRISSSEVPKTRIYSASNWVWESFSGVYCKFGFMYNALKTPVKEYCLNYYFIHILLYLYKYLSPWG
jgi:hypothetical protein